MNLHQQKSLNNQNQITIPQLSLMPNKLIHHNSNHVTHHNSNNVSNRALFLTKSTLNSSNMNPNLNSLITKHLANRVQQQGNYYMNNQNLLLNKTIHYSSNSKLSTDNAYYMNSQKRKQSNSNFQLILGLVTNEPIKPANGHRSLIQQSLNKIKKSSSQNQKQISVQAADESQDYTISSYSYALRKVQKNLEDKKSQSQNQLQTDQNISRTNSVLNEALKQQPTQIRRSRPQSALKTIIKSTREIDQNPEYTPIKLLPSLVSSQQHIKYQDSQNQIQYQKNYMIQDYIKVQQQDNMCELKARIRISRPQSAIQTILKQSRQVNLNSQVFIHTESIHVVSSNKIHDEKTNFIDQEQPKIYQKDVPEILTQLETINFTFDFKPYDFNDDNKVSDKYKLQNPTGSKQPYLEKTHEPNLIKIQETQQNNLIGPQPIQILTQPLQQKKNQIQSQNEVILTNYLPIFKRPSNHQRSQRVNSRMNDNKPIFNYGEVEEIEEIPDVQVYDHQKSKINSQESIKSNHTDIAEIYTFSEAKRQINDPIKSPQNDLDLKYSRDIDVTPVISRKQRFQTPTPVPILLDFKNHVQFYSKCTLRLNIIGNCVAECITLLEANKNVWIIPMFLIFKRMNQLRRQVMMDLNQDFNAYQLPNFSQFKQSQECLNLMTSLQDEQKQVEIELSGLLTQTQKKLIKLDKESQSKLIDLINLDYSSDIKSLVFVYLQSQVLARIQQVLRHLKSGKEAKKVNGIQSIREWDLLLIRVLATLLILEQPLYDNDLFDNNELDRMILDGQGTSLEKYMSSLEDRVEKLKDGLSDSYEF